MGRGNQRRDVHRYLRVGRRRRSARARGADGVAVCELRSIRWPIITTIDNRLGVITAVDFDNSPQACDHDCGRVIYVSSFYIWLSATDKAPAHA